MLLYSNLNWLKNYLDDSKLKRFDHWLAQWASAPTYTGAFGMWQSSSTGKVSGINGNVDTDIAYKDYPTIIKNAKLNGFTGSGQTPTVPPAGTATFRFLQKTQISSDYRHVLWRPDHPSLGEGKELVRPSCEWQPCRYRQSEDAERHLYPVNAPISNW